ASLSFSAATRAVSAVLLMVPSFPRAKAAERRSLPCPSCSSFSQADSPLPRKDCALAVGATRARIVKIVRVRMGMSPSGLRFALSGFLALVGKHDGLGLLG